jgi:glutamyl-tRNA reductase
MGLYLFGISHHNTSLEEREQLVINTSVLKDLRPIINSKLNNEITSLVNLSTCNRTEIIFESAQDLSKELCEVICNYLGCNLEIHKHFFFLNNEDALMHLCMVATGLDSRIIGEHEILGQFKESIDISKRLKFISGSFESLLNDVISIAKSARSNSEIGKNPVSISTLVFKLVREIFENPQSLSVLMIGAGEIGFSILENLHSQGISKLAFVNRTTKNIQLGSDTLTSKPLNSIKNSISNCDVLIASTKSQIPIVGKGLIEQVITERRKKPLILIDLGVPRNIEPSISNLDGAYLYTLDQIELIAQRNQVSRAQAADKAKDLIRKNLTEMDQKNKIRAASFKARSLLIDLFATLDPKEVKQLKELKNDDYHTIIENFYAELLKQDLNIERHVFHSLIEEITNAKSY